MNTQIKSKSISAKALPDAGGTVQLGLRERNKRDKFLRICAAAEALFLSEGYDDATLRTIARRADVGLGTLFSYATDKRDLLFLIYNDRIFDMTQQAVDGLNPRGTLHEMLMSIFQRHYLFFMQQPKLSRIMLRELNFYNDTLQATRFQATRSQVLVLVAAALGHAKTHGELPDSVDEIEWSRLIFAIYQMELRHWLNVEPLQIETGLARLEKSFRLLCHGLNAIVTK